MMSSVNVCIQMKEICNIKSNRSKKDSIEIKPRTESDTDSCWIYSHSVLYSQLKQLAN